MSWKTLSINNELYLIKYIKMDEEKKITCFLSDFKCIWKETLKFGDIIKRANDLNPLIQNEEESTVLNTILEPAVHCQLNENGNTTNNNNNNNNRALLNDDSLAATVDVDTELKIFRNKYYIMDDVPFKFLWKLMQCSQTVFYNEITKPLLLLVTITSMQQTDLKECLRKKDTEIEQYKIEGAQLIRKTVSTLPFNESEFNQKFTLKNELDNSFLELSKNEKHLNAIEKFCDIKLLPCGTATKSIASNTSPNNKHIGKSGSSNKRDNKKSLKDMIALRKFHTAIDTKIIYNNTDDPSSQEDNYEDNDVVKSNEDQSNDNDDDDKTNSVSSINDNIKTATVNEEVDGQPAKKMKIRPKLNLYKK